MATAAAAEGWKRSGLLRGVGIPAPSGHYGQVGCVDLMHQFEGESDGLLVRLFYPTAVEYQQGRYEFANWRPHKQYMRGVLDFYRSRAAGLKSAFLRTITGIMTYPTTHTTMQLHSFVTVLISRVQLPRSLLCMEHHSTVVNQPLSPRLSPQSPKALVTKGLIRVSQPQLVMKGLMTKQPIRKRYQHWPHPPIFSQ